MAFDSQKYPRKYPQEYNPYKVPSFNYYYLLISILTKKGFDDFNPTLHDGHC